MRPALRLRDLRVRVRAGGAWERERDRDLARRVAPRLRDRDLLLPPVFLRVRLREREREGDLLPRGEGERRRLAASPRSLQVVSVQERRQSDS